MSDIKLVRLKSGEELIGKVTEIDTGLHMDSPTVLVPTGNGSIGLMPYMPYTKAVDDGLDLPSDFILFVLELNSELENHYQSSFGNGIVVPQGPQGAGLVDGAGLKLTQ